MKQKTLRVGLALVSVLAVAGFAVTAFGEPIPAPTATPRIPIQPLPPMPTITAKPIFPAPPVAPIAPNPNNVTVPSGKAIVATCPDTMASAQNQGNATTWAQLWYGGPFQSATYSNFPGQGTPQLLCNYMHDTTSGSHNGNGLQSLNIPNRTGCSITNDDHKTLLCDK